MDFTQDMTSEELGEFLQLNGLHDDIVSTFVAHIKCLVKPSLNSLKETDT